MSSDSLTDKQVAQDIIKTLGEKQKKPVAQIYNIVKLCGSEFAKVMLEAAQAIQEDGGMKVQDGSRNRTLGGVFFYLVRGALPLDLAEMIFPTKFRRSAPTKPTTLEWEERAKHLKSMLEKPTGEVIDVNISVEGRPKSIKVVEDVVIATLESEVEAYQTFPRGIPDVPNDPTLFVVYVGKRQWDKHIKDKLDKDEDGSIEVEGSPAFDGETKGIAVFARAVRFRSGKQNQREEERRKQGQEAQRKEKQKVEAKRKARQAKEEKLKEKVEDLPDDLAKKLRPLYGARDLFRKRLADIEALPEEKQSGLKAAKMALARTEKQIATLEAKMGKAAAPDEATDDSAADDDTEQD